MQPTLINLDEATSPFKPAAKYHFKHAALNGQTDAPDEGSQFFRLHPAITAASGQQRRWHVETIGQDLRFQGGHANFFDDQSVV